METQGSTDGRDCIGDACVKIADIAVSIASDDPQLRVIVNAAMTEFLETASDDWFADLDADGLPDLAVGRLPARTVAEADVMVSKLVGYEAWGGVGGQALLVADRNDDYNFEAMNAQVRALLPDAMTVQEVLRGQTDDAAARAAIMDGIDEGPLLVNYIGHGSVEIWRGNLLTSSAAGGLTNGRPLPLVVSMTCLNGFFHDLYSESLAEALMKADGGAVAVWASSGLTYPYGQAAMNRELLRLLFGGAQSPTLGEAVMQAKLATEDQDVRRTWILFGDPTMRIVSGN